MSMNYVQKQEPKLNADNGSVWKWINILEKITNYVPDNITNSWKSGDLIDLYLRTILSKTKAVNERKWWTSFWNEILGTHLLYKQTTLSTNKNLFYSYSAIFICPLEKNL